MTNMTEPTEPTLGASFDLFAQKLPGRYVGFYPSEIHFATSGPEPIIPVRVTVLVDSEATEADYWGWWGADNNRVRFIWRRKSLVEMCFAYGSEVETARGRGRIVRLRVEEVLQA